VLGKEREGKLLKIFSKKRGKKHQKKKKSQTHVVGGWSRRQTGNHGSNRCRKKLFFSGKLHDEKTMRHPLDTKTTQRRSMKLGGWGS